MAENSTISFKLFCELCNKICQAQKHKKLEILSKFYDNWKKIDQERSFYPILRLLLPQLDRDRGAYGIKEHKLAKIYIRVLGIPSNSTDALRLLNYRAPASGKYSGDFADVAFCILKRRCGAGDDLSIDDINGALDEISTKNCDNDPRGIDSELMTLLQSTSAEEQKWLIRVILKDMKLGLGQSTIFDIVHPDAKEFYDAFNNLSKLCEKLKDPTFKLNEVEIEVFSPFRPMLCDELDIRRIGELFNSAPYFFVETKMDGERFQIHMKDGNYKYFSRRAFDYTSNYGADALNGMLTPYLSKLISPNVESFILDGEMMCWNTKKKTFTTKGMEIDVKKLKDTHVHRPCFCPFDILYKNGEVLTNKSLVFRLETLNQVIKPEEGIVSFVPRIRVSEKEEVYEALNKAIDDCEEGIIVKHFQSVYKPNARKNGGWYKIKPEYTNALMDTLDLLIIGGFYGEGRYKGISHFLLGVKAEDKFFSVARVGGGYSFAQLSELQKKLEPHWTPYRNDFMPSDIEWTKQKPDVWINPCDSIILEIKASEIVPSDMYRTNKTLRFPRVLNIRYDKSPNDCLKLSEFETKSNTSAGKLATHHLTDELTSPLPPKIRKTKSSFELGEQFKAIDTSEIKVVSEILDGKEICVMSGCESLSKEDVEKRIVRFGGKSVQNPGINTWCVLSDEETLRVRNISAKCDVIRCSWLLSLLSRKTVSLPEVPRHGYLSLSLRTSSRLRRHYDEFGDHYTIPATKDSLIQCFSAAKKVEFSLLTEVEKADLEEELFGGPNPYRIFRRIVAFSPLKVNDGSLKTHSIMQFDDRIALFDFSSNGGQLVEDLNANVTHVICPSDKDILTELKEIRKTRDKKFHIVSSEWVRSCIGEKTIRDERLYPPQMPSE